MPLANTLKIIGILSEERYESLLQVDPGILRWDMRNGTPFADGTFDMVYHSHFLEHIDRKAAPYLLKECRRVLKQGGIIRVVVPDLEQAVIKYMTSLERLRDGDAEAATHYAEAMDGLFDQFSREQTFGSSKQRPFVKFLEKLIRGGVSESGELHRWMYDEYSLKSSLESVGFRNVWKKDAFSSSIEGWEEYWLDADKDGTIYKHDSLYMEGMK
jgi:SAM-dependent methyltransferase